MTQEGREGRMVTGKAMNEERDRKGRQGEMERGGKEGKQGQRRQQVSGKALRRHQHPLSRSLALG